MSQTTDLQSAKRPIAQHSQFRKTEDGCVDICFYDQRYLGEYLPTPIVLAGIHSRTISTIIPQSTFCPSSGNRTHILLIHSWIGYRREMYSSLCFALVKLQKDFARLEGFEPPPTVLETVMLPLHYKRIYLLLKFKSIYCSNLRFLRSVQDLNLC